MQSMDMEKYYKYRKEIGELFLHDTDNIGNLACKVLEIRDKNKCVNSINLSIQEGEISVELDNSTTNKKKTDIVNKIINCIGRYIVDNKSKLDKETAESEEFNDAILNNNNFCDIYSIGDEVVFRLF